MRVLSLALLVWAVAAAACSPGSNAGGDRPGDGGTGGWAPGGSGGGGSGGTGGDGGQGGPGGSGGGGEGGGGPATLGRRIDDGAWGGEVFATGSRDGVAYLAGCTGDTCDLRFWNDAVATSRRLAGGVTGATNLRVSPDGRRLAFRVDRDSAASGPAGEGGLLDIPGGNVVSLGAGAEGFRFDPGATWLAWVDRAAGELQLLDLRDGGRRAACTVGSYPWWRLGTTALLCRDDGALGLVRWDLERGTRDVIGDSDAEAEWHSADLRDVVVRDRIDPVSGLERLSLWGSDGTRLTVADDVESGEVRWMGGADRFLFPAASADEGAHRIVRLDVPARRVETVAAAAVAASPSMNLGQVYLLDTEPGSGVVGALRSWDEASGTASPVADGVAMALSRWPTYGLWWAAGAVPGRWAVHHHRFADGSTRLLGDGAAVDLVWDAGVVYRHDFEEATGLATLSVLFADSGETVDVVRAVDIEPPPRPEEIGGCDGPIFSSDLERGLVTAGCGSGGEVFAWTRTGGLRPLGRARLLGITENVDGVVYLRREVSGTAGELRLFDLATGVDALLADGVAADGYAAISAEGEGDGDPLTFDRGDRIAFLAGCPNGTPAESCRYEVRVLDLGTGSTEVATADVPYLTRLSFSGGILTIDVPNRAESYGPFERRLWAAGRGPAVTVLRSWSPHWTAFPATSADGRYLFAVDEVELVGEELRGRLVLVDREALTAVTLDDGVSEDQVWRAATSPGVAWGRPDGTLWMAPVSDPTPIAIASGVRLPTASYGTASVGPIATPDALLYEVIEGPDRGGWAIRWPR